jgi:outer membrane protein assembly factor BamE
MRMKFVALLPLFLLSVGCATTPHEQWKKVKVGMYKDEVLEIMDSPQRTQRWHGLDRWTYVYFDKSSEEKQLKEVHFQEGKANYVGEIYKPLVSAEERDNINEASNREVEVAVQSRKDQNLKEYSGYEDSVTGGKSTNVYVPQYRSIDGSSPATPGSDSNSAE